MTKAWIPTAAHVTAETLAVIAGAFLGAIIISQSPRAKAWLQANYTFPVPDGLIGESAKVSATYTGAAPT